MSKRNHSRSAAPYAKGYSEAGASVTRRALKGFTPDSGSPNEDINRNNATLRQRSRMLYMASPVATSAINTNRTKVVGTGLTLKATVDRDLLGLSPEAAKEWQHKAEMEFRLWGGKKQNCDALGLNNFMALQQLALKSWLMSGDVFVLVKRYPATPLNPYSMRLHVIEADRVSTPTDFSGGYTYGGFVDAVVPDGRPGAGHRVFEDRPLRLHKKVLRAHRHAAAVAVQPQRQQQLIQAEQPPDRRGPPQGAAEDRTVKA